MTSAIAVDARVLAEEHTGVATYTSSLLAAMADMRPETTWLLVSHKAIDPNRLWRHHCPERVTYRVIPFPRPMLVRPFWDHVLLPWLLRWERPLLWFSPLGIVPRCLGGIPSVVTIHDLAFCRMTDIQPAKYRAIWTRMLKRAAGKAAFAICVSASTQRDWVELLNGQSDRTTVIYEGVDTQRFVLEDQGDGEQLKALGVNPGYLLAVGTLEPRKNYEFLLDVYESLLREMSAPPRLFIVGGDGWLSEATRRRIDRLGPHVHRFGYIDHHQLPTLYRYAAALLFPTRYEGFGLPMLEALASGTPVIASDIPVCREVGGDAAVYAPLGDISHWIQCIQDVLHANPEREKLRAHAQSFTWEKAAEATWKVFDTVQQKRPA